MAAARMSPLRRVLRSAVTVLAMLVVYAVIPIPGRRGPVVHDLLLLAVGLSVLAYVVWVLARQSVSSEESGIRLEALAVFFYAVVVFYSVVYLGIANTAGEFSGLDNRVDSLYFTMTTLTTVGYGDIHAVGKVARIAVTTQLFFDVIFIGLAARLVGPALARAAAAHVAASSEAGDDEPGRRWRRRKG